ncbi:MAG: DUF4388 domain-containing protein [Myxococcota bacterium]
MHLDCHTKRSESGPSLLDVLQLFHFSAGAYQLEVASDARSGRIFMVDGDVHDASFDKTVGEAALGEMLAADELIVRAAPTLRRPGRRSIERSFQEVVLDLLRHQDEAQREEASPELALPGRRVWIPERRLLEWQRTKDGVHHVALIERVGFRILACDDRKAWSGLTDTPFFRALLAAFFVGSAGEAVGQDSEPIEAHSMATVKQRHYFVHGVGEDSVLAAFVLDADRINLGLALTHATALRRWVDDLPPQSVPPPASLPPRGSRAPRAPGVPSGIFARVAGETRAAESES